MNDLPRQADVVFVGAGHNALVGAAYLLAAGRSVCLLDRMTQPGGWVRTAQLGAPGFYHDQWSALHPAFVGGPAWAELGPDLRRHGLEYVTAPLSTGCSLPGGRTAVCPVDQAELAAELARLGDSRGWTALFADAEPCLSPLPGMLGAGLDSPAAGAALTNLLRDSRPSVLPFSQLLAMSAAELVRRYFGSEELRMLAAPWPLHLGASPDDPPSAFWAVFALAAFAAAGMPTPVGGSGRLAEALADLVTERGGDLFCGVDVDQVVVRDGHAAGILTSDRVRVAAREAVIVSATPDQLYGRLLRDVAGVPAGVRDQAAGYRYKRGCFQINLALSARPHFRDPRMDAGGAMNLGRGLDDLVTSVRQAEAGLLPEHPSISWHEPTAVDPTRAPDGQAVARLQVLEAPHTPRGDAAGTRYGTSGWDDAASRFFADRVLDEAELHLPDLTGLVLERHITTPADLALSNSNAGPGDSCAGDNSLAQAFTERPIPAHGGGHRTSVPGLWLIGAATWPGPGVSGASGRAVAQAIAGGV